MTRARSLPILLLLLAVAAFTGCDSPNGTVESLRRDIAAYKADPSPEREASIQASFQKLDEQIEALETSGKSSEATTYRDSEANLRADFRAARMVQALEDAQSAVKDVGDAFKEAGRSIGEVFRSPAEPATSRSDPE